MKIQTIDTSKAVTMDHDFDSNNNVLYDIEHCYDMDKNPITIFSVWDKKKGYITFLYKGYCDSWVNSDNIPTTHFKLY